MKNLVPEWAWEYKEFWASIRKRNLWLIELRYGVVVMLVSCLIISKYFFEIEYSQTQFIAIVVITASIFCYNIMFHKVRKFLKCNPQGFNPLYFSLIQMIFDLIALLLLVYYTGSIESPLYLLFVFHTIIGSLILPSIVVYAVASSFVVLFIAMLALEHFKVIPHHQVIGLLQIPLYDNLHFIIVFLITFTFMIFVIVYLTNKIVGQLYSLEKDLYDSNKRINAAEKEKQKYIMGIVHEIKAPIAAVASYLDIVLQKFLGPIDENVEDKLKRAKYRTDEGIQLINDVLNISKLTLYDKFDEEDLDMEELISSVIKRLKPVATSHLIELSLKDKREKKKKISGDKFLLDIALSNLIVNSIKYGIDGGKVEVSLDNENNSQLITVCDNGLGIPADELPKIFKDFYRASNVKKVYSEGSGLGLSVVKKVVERHGGHIEVKSPSKMGGMKNPGTCFTITLPLPTK
jgi:signal transduction histidine kinase